MLQKADGLESAGDKKLLDGVTLVSLPSGEYGVDFACVSVV
jgi:hypothetical protein